MSLENGTKLGPYEILSPLGAGGMGEVYRAKDARLDREVAIKVLPEAFSCDPERLARFQREAKVLASLNHPNIAAIYGFEEANEKNFLVMELVEGDTLAERVKPGPMSVEEALSVGKQIAEALEAAHDKGIIHRDLKPANVKITPEGKVKVLDFGLAKALATFDEHTGTVIENSPTITIGVSPTAPGIIMGTAAYMSPEQARGKPLDKRTDIWSFGVVLLECLTGRTLFGGETISDSIGAILHKAPDWTTLPGGTPPTVHLLLRRCLTKDATKRLRDIGDARIELENAIADPTSTSLGLAQAALDVKTRWLPSWPVNVAIVALLTLAVAGGWYAKPQQKDSSPVVRLTAEIPQGQMLISSPGLQIVAISPDASLLAYTATTNTGVKVCLRHMHQRESVALANTIDADSPTFSPNGRWIAFAQQGKLKKISVSGGPAQTICDAPQLRGAHWGVIDTIAFAPTRRSGIWIVSAEGGKPEKVTDLGPDPGPKSHRWPQLLPDGRTILFTQTDNEDDYTAARIEAVSLDTRQRKTLIEGAMYARYVPTGHLVFVRGDVLMAVAFDPVSIEIIGPEISVLENLVSNPGMGTGQYSFSDNGVLVYQSGTEDSRLTELVWIDRTGKITPASQHSREALSQSLSPDGSRIAWVLHSGDGFPPDIWVLEIKRDMLTRLTFDDGVETHPVWSPDGSWIYFSSDRVHGVAEIYRRRADGSGDAERLTTAENPQAPRSISPDSNTLVFTESLDTGGEIMLLHMDNERSVEPFLKTPFGEWGPAVSPDGTLIAYSSNETGVFELYVRRFPSGTGRVKISPGLGTGPKWSPDGTELFYTDNGSKFYSVAIEVKDEVVIPSAPKLMFELSKGVYAKRVNSVSTGIFNVAPDGQRFLFGKSQESARVGRDHPIVVVNWFKELREKMAAAKDR